jgi:hypothetical protein
MLDNKTLLMLALIALAYYIFVKPEYFADTPAAAVKCPKEKETQQVTMPDGTLKTVTWPKKSAGKTSEKYCTPNHVPGRRRVRKCNDDGTWGPIDSSNC